MGVKKVWDKLVGTVGGVNEDDEFETDEYEDEEEMEEERPPHAGRSSAPFQRQLCSTAGKTAAHGHRRTGNL